MFLIVFLYHQVSVPISLCIQLSPTPECILGCPTVCHHHHHHHSCLAACTHTLTCSPLGSGSFVRELFLKRVLALNLLLQFLHSQNLVCVCALRVVFLVCTCTFPAYSALLHITCTRGLCVSMLAYQPRCGGLFLVSFIGAFGPHSIGNTQGLLLLDTHLPSALCMHISSASLTTPVLRCEPVTALPSHICCWALARGDPFF